MLQWKTISITINNAKGFFIGFSLINKVKEILQFKRVFHNYGCYYPSHGYALNIFEVFIENIKVFWHEVCLIIKTISREAIKSNAIEPESYLLIAEGERTQ